MEKLNNQTLFDCPDCGNMYPIKYILCPDCTDYCVMDNETGYPVTGFNDLEEAEDEINFLEACDRREGKYLADKYFILNNN